MPKGKSHVRRHKMQERSVRTALKRERKAVACLSPGDPEFKSFANQLAVQGLTIKDVPGDGNCLFRALADQLSDGHSNHRVIRRAVVAHMRRNREHFAPFLEEDVPFEDYLAELAKDGQYAGNDAIVAFSCCYGAHVVIHQLNEPRWEVHAPCTTGTVKTLHIAYLNGDHYCSVLPIAPAESAEPLPLPQLTGKGEEGVHTSKKSKSTSCSVSTCGAGYTCEAGYTSPTQRVVAATGCKDMVLVDQCLRENSYDTDLAIVELLQLMSLAEECPGPPANEQLLHSHLHIQPSAPLSASPCGGGDGSEKPSGPLSISKPPSTSGAANSYKKPLKHAQQIKHWLSNRERKEQAKASRKQCRTNERKGNRTMPKEDTTPDPVGATAI